jgi:tetratricopeptide (TPR) repeat protein
MLNRDDILQRAELLRRQKRYKDAEQQLGILLKIDPQDVDGLIILGHCKIDTHQLVEANSILKQCLQYDANNDYVFYLLAFANYQDSNNQLALNYLTQALAIFPYNAGYFALQAHIRLEQNEFGFALNAANEGLAVDAESVSCLNARSTALFRLNRKEEAYETINEALELDPEDYSTHTNYGWHYLEKGKYKNATNHFKEALRLNPNYAYAKQGYKAALKSRMPFYRWILQYSLWIGRQQRSVRIGIPVGLWLLVNIISSVKNNPFLKYLGLSVLIVYILFVIMSWLGSAFANLYLLFTPHGKYILDKSERYSAIAVGVFMGLGILLLIPAFTINENLFVLAAIVASLAMPCNELAFPIKLFKGSGRLISVHIMLILGIATCISMFVNIDVATFFGVIYFIFFVGFMWTSSLRILR